MDNGSGDGTAEFLAREIPSVMVESSEAPLSFAAAVNRGIRRARYSHVCLLNNDMALGPGFFAPLARAFAAGAGPFCATAQILFPAGVRREETGKAVFAPRGPRDFPVRCEEPLEGEDLSWVLYGSGGCSLYCAAKLRALGGVERSLRARLRGGPGPRVPRVAAGWPSVFVAGARVEHQHRATTSRYYTEEELSRILEINWMRFLAGGGGLAEVVPRYVAGGGAAPPPAWPGGRAAPPPAAYPATARRGHRAGQEAQKVELEDAARAHLRIKARGGRAMAGDHARAGHEHESASRAARRGSRGRDPPRRRARKLSLKPPSAAASPVS